eukprot:TRINITY_DN9400_c0_g1_i1.p1 TRINITY_DN9400_c0_g1~~TRINITY_DN9400_c0_g1_i1.p1  ORF type:complete len:134 (+),score=26.70 TRINITY_DN9400_c0_g1_i1:405-806(+)
MTNRQTGLYLQSDGHGQHCESDEDTIRLAQHRAVKGRPSGHTGPNSDRGEVDEVADLLRAGLRWDLDHTTYRILEFEGAMSSVVSTTMEQCLKLRPDGTAANDAARADFKNLILTYEPDFRNRNPILCTALPC